MGEAFANLCKAFWNFGGAFTDTLASVLHKHPKASAVCLELLLLAAAVMWFRLNREIKNLQLAVEGERSRQTIITNRPPAAPPKKLFDGTDFVMIAGIAVILCFIFAMVI